MLPSANTTDNYPHTSGSKNETNLYFPARAQVTNAFTLVSEIVCGFGSVLMGETVSVALRR